MIPKLAILCVVATITLSAYAESKSKQQLLSLPGLVGHLEEKYDIKKSAELRRASIQAGYNSEGSLFGALEIEIEYARDNSDEVRNQYFLEQPLSLGGSKSALKTALEAEADVVASEFTHDLNTTGETIARRLIALKNSEEMLSILSEEIRFLESTLKDLGAGRLVQNPLLSDIVALKLKSAKEHADRLLDGNAQVIDWLAQYQLNPETRLELPPFELFARDQILRRISTSPAVRQISAQADAASGRAEFVKNRFDVNVGVGTEFGPNNERSYLLRLRAPVGQLYTNQASVKKLRQDQAVLSDRARMRMEALRSRLEELITTTGISEKQLKASENELVEWQRIFDLTYSGYRRGLVQYGELREAFERIQSIHKDIVEFRKGIDIAKVEIFFLAGGWQ